MEQAWPERQHRVAITADKRFAGLDLEYYRQRIPDDLFRLLMDLVGVRPASATFDPKEMGSEDTSTLNAPIRSIGGMRDDD